MTKFTQYVLSFYGSDSDLYPEYGFTAAQVELATEILKRRRVEQNAEFLGDDCDSWDRESVRDIILEAREGTLPEFAKI